MLHLLIYLPSGIGDGDDVPQPKWKQMPSMIPNKLNTVFNVIKLLKSKVKFQNFREIKLFLVCGGLNMVSLDQNVPLRTTAPSIFRQPANCSTS